MFTAQPEPPKLDDAWQIEVNYDKLHEHLNAGNNVLLDNGLIPTCSRNISQASAMQSFTRCKVKKQKTCNLPGIETDLPSLTEKDRLDTIVGIGMSTIFFALSFTRNADAIDLFKTFSKTTKVWLR